MYFTEPEPNLGGRRIECARGKVIGGSSSINAMTYSRGHRGDYDRWAANGLPSWSYAHALPYFKKQETWEDGASAHRGGDGPLGTCWSTFEDPLADAYTEASKAAGLKWNADLNSGDNEGIGRNQNTIRDGRRCSAAVAYLQAGDGAAQSHRRDRRARLAHRARRQPRRRRRISHAAATPTRCAPTARCCSPAA